MASLRTFGATITILIGILSGLIIIAGFVNIEWTLNHIGVVGFTGAVAVEVVCAVIANLWNLPQIIREEVT
jgi:chromate transport protein ChrA